MTNLRERFESKYQVDRNTGCFLWVGKLPEQGYPVLMMGKKNKRASHVAFFLAHGVWPTPGMKVQHVCDNPRCVNAKHLVLGTDYSNQKDKWVKGRGHNTGRKLTEHDVVEIHGLRAAGMKVMDIARRFGMSRQGMQYVLSGKRWGHLHPANQPMIKEAVDNAVFELTGRQIVREAVDAQVVMDELISELEELAGRLMSEPCPCNSGMTLRECCIARDIDAIYG